MKKQKKLQVYHGTGPASTHVIIAKSSFLGDGVCLNLFKGFNKIKKDFDRIEELGLQIFIDNGSIERFQHAFNKKTSPDKKIRVEDYFDMNESMKYFEYITAEYIKLFQHAKHPERLIITVPEVVASAELTQALQAKFLPRYKAWQDQYGFKMIISMQFNPQSDTWEHEMVESAKFISKNIKPSAKLVKRVGIPFGLDFRPIQKEEEFAKIDKVFSEGDLAGHQAHLFAAGSPAKVIRFTPDWVDSVDSSTINNWAKYAHYLTKDGEYFDVRDLQGVGKQGRPTPPEKQKAMFAKMRAEGIDPKLWLSRERDFPGVNNWRYTILLERFDSVLDRLKGWELASKSPALAAMINKVNKAMHPIHKKKGK